jgi:hypothetical protein
MLINILRFEVKNRFSQWTTIIFILMLAFQGIWYTKGTYDYYINDAVLMNAPSIFYKNFAAGGMLMIIMVAILTGTVLYKDIEYKAGQWVYALPIEEKLFFLGKFLAAYCINVLIAFSYFIGMLLVPYSGIGAAHQFGPTPLGQMIHGFVVLTMPNLFLMTSIIFCALVYGRKMAAGYLALTVLVMTFLVSQSVAEGSGATPFLLVAESFGYVALENILDTMTSAQKNTAYLRFTGYLLVNRLLWFAIASLLLFLSYRRFTFKYFFNTDTRKSGLHEENHPRVYTEKIKSPGLSFTSLDLFKKLFSLAALEFKNIVRPSGFKVIMGLILLMVMLQNMLWNATYYIGPAHPITAHMVNFRLTFGVYIMILLMIWAGELFFKDKTLKVWQIMDALPVPVWVAQGAKLLAMLSIALVLASSFVVLGILAQLLQGGLDLINLGQYVDDVLGFRWGAITYGFWICLTFFIGGLTGNRYLTHILSIGCFFFMILSFELGLAEQTIFAYSAVPGIEDYSEISGYGIWALASRWYFAMWVALVVALVLLGILFWERGVGQNWSRKLSFHNTQLKWPGKIVVLGALALFFVLQSFIIKNVNGKGNFKSSEQSEQEAADYEKKYARLASIAQPWYQDVELKLDFFPAKRSAQYHAKIKLQNVQTQAIDTLYLSFPDFVRIKSISCGEQVLLPLWKDQVHGIYAYRLPQPLPMSTSVLLELRAEKAYEGFTQSGDEPQPDLMFNGSFGSIRDYLPVIGFVEEKVLVENRKRAAYGLPRLSSRMAPLDDSTALQQDGYASDALWLKGRITLSTAADQIAYAPGRLHKQWQASGRNYFSYVLDQSAPFHWYLGSGVLKQSIKKQEGIKTSIFYDPKHPFNIVLYQMILGKALSFGQQYWNEYPYTELRLVEIPYYQDKFYAFPNTIAISEKEGWLANAEGLKERAYLYLTLASQVFKHWGLQQIPVANVQGAEMLKTALPEALALAFVKAELGQEAVAGLVEKKRLLYEKERNNEPNQEAPLLYADGADYLEVNKGAIALYEAIQDIGLPLFMEKIQALNKQKDAPLQTFTAFYQMLEPQLDAERRTVFDKLD